MSRDIPVELLLATYSELVDIRPSFLPYPGVYSALSHPASLSIELHSRLLFARKWPYLFPLVISVRTEHYLVRLEWELVHLAQKLYLGIV